jgi:hypothetical protein
MSNLKQFLVIHSTQEATRSDLGITYKKGVTPYYHSTGIDTYLELGVRVCTTRVSIGGSDTKPRM